MKSKIAKISFLIIALTIGFFFYNYKTNDYSNVIITVLNSSAIEKSIYMDIYWDNNKIVSDYIDSPFPIKNYKFNSSLGKHFIQIKGINFEENYKIWVLPFSHIAIEYTGNNSDNNQSFIIRESIFPLMFD